MWGTEEIDDWIFGLMGALGVELIIWEMLGNSDLVINKIRAEPESDVTAYTSTVGKDLLQ